MDASNAMEAVNELRHGIEAEQEQVQEQLQEQLRSIALQIRRLREETTGYQTEIWKIVNDHSQNLSTSSQTTDEHKREFVLYCGGACLNYCTLHGDKDVNDEGYETSWRQDLEFAETAIRPAKVYTPINIWQTRLLVLKRGSFGEPLKADLCTVDLVHSSGAIQHDRQVRIEYEALSYFWGDPVPVASIECNGVSHPISRNLNSALQRLRAPLRERYLWIDALCINQHDQSERSMQVSNMLLIYQKAQKVLVWLGEQSRHTARLLRCFALPNAKLCTAHSESVCEGAQDLLKRPWFRRVWVKQEVWAASEIDVICGNQVISWKNFESAVRQFLEETERDPLLESRNTWPGSRSPEAKGVHYWLSTIQNPLSGLRRASKTQRALISVLGQEAEELHALLRSSTGHPSPTREEGELLTVLIRTSAAECSDLRDHVYAVLGMTGVSHGSIQHSPAAETKLVVDYDLSTAQVYQDVIKYYVQRDQSLWVLNALLDFRYRCRGLTLGDMVESIKLPSWCPNWSLAMDLSSDERDSTDEAVWGLHGSNCELRTKCQSLIDRRDSCLRLRGIVLPTIKWVEHADPTFAKSSRVRDWQFETEGYPQTSILPWSKREPDKSNTQLHDHFKKLNKLGDGARWWLLRGRAPLKDDILVAIEGSVAPFVLRRHNSRFRFEFIGIAVNMRKGPHPSPSRGIQEAIVSKSIELIQDLLIAAKEHGLLQPFLLTRAIVSRSVREGVSNTRYFGTIVFTDLRAAVILFALPDDLAIREIAIAMLSKVDDKYKFDRTSFSEYDWRKCWDNRAAESDLLKSEASKPAKAKGTSILKFTERAWHLNRAPHAIAEVNALGEGVASDPLCSSGLQHRVRSIALNVNYERTYQSEAFRRKS